MGQPLEDEDEHEMRVWEGNWKRVTEVEALWN